MSVLSFSKEPANVSNPMSSLLLSGLRSNETCSIILESLEATSWLLKPSTTQARLFFPTAVLLRCRLRRGFLVSLWRHLPTTVDRAFVRFWAVRVRPAAEPKGAARREGAFRALLK